MTEPQQQNMTLGDALDMAIALHHEGKLAEAKNIYEQILVARPDNADALHFLGDVLRVEGELEQAEKSIKKAIALRPELAGAHYHLGVLYLQKKAEDAARECFRAALNHRPDFPSARHMLDALEGRYGENNAYIQSVFDKSAAYFEEKLVDTLGYHAPGLMKNMLVDYIGEERINKALDLGCGTGLLGREIRSLVNELSGVDLSPEMIKQAQQKGGYDDLHAGDILEFLNGSTENYDLVSAADVFIYVGDLVDVFSAVKQKTQPEALFLFCTEKLERTDQSYGIMPSGRFRHSAAYIEKLSQDHGFIILNHKTSPLRKEAGQEVAGDYFLLQTV